MDRKNVVVLIAALILGLQQQGFCAELADNLNPNLLNAVSAMDTETQASVLPVSKQENAATQMSKLRPSIDLQQATVKNQSQQDLTANPKAQPQIKAKEDYPIMTSDMSIKQKKNKLTKYIIDCGYSKAYVTDIIEDIHLENVTENFAPSFYMSLEKGYIEKYIGTRYLSKYFTDEATMAKINKLIELMVSNGYSKNSIYNTINNIVWSDVKEDFAPSFYIVLEKEYIEKYINTYNLGKYFTNEATMEKINKSIEHMASNGYSENSIYPVINNVVWSDVKEDFPPSLYTALQKKYVGKYISADELNTYFTDETIMNKMNKLIELMVSKSYSRYDVYNTIKYIKWSDVKEDFAPSFYVELEKGYIEKYISTRYLSKYFTDEATMAKMNKLIEVMISNSYSKDSIYSTINNTAWLLDAKEDFAPSFYSALEKGYIKYIDIKELNKYFTDETIMAKINDLIEYMISKKYSKRKIETRITQYAIDVISTYKKEELVNLSNAQLLKNVEKNIPLVYKTPVLKTVKNWHDNNMYHDSVADYENTAIALCLFSCYGGISAFIIPPVVLAGFIVTETLYLPVGLMGGYWN